MKLSIIIPYYKTLEYTKKLFNVLEPQLTKEVEVILVDDGCNEKELDKLKAKVIHLEQPSGNASKPRNIGLDNAKGKYIAFIDSDDSIAEDYIETILEATKEEWDYCYISWNWKKGNIIIKDEPPEWNKSIWNCIYKKEAIGDTRFNLNKNIGEDAEFIEKVRKGKRYNITKVLYYYNWGRENSLTTLYSQGTINRESIRCGLLVYQMFVSKIGGIETYLYNFFKLLSPYYDILFVYREADLEQLRRYRKLVRCLKFNEQKFICDKYVCASNQENIADYVNSLSGEYLDMIQADLSAMSWRYKPHKKTTKHIAISNVAKRAIEQQDDKPCKVIYAPLELEEQTKPLMIMSAQRMSKEKGEEEMKSFSRRLKQKGIPFIWINFTDNKVGEEDGIIFKDSVLDLHNYYKAFDYFASFSRTESYGYSNVEAMSYGLPLIVRDIPVLKELGFEDGKHGYKLKEDLSNMDEVIDKLAKKPKCVYNKLDDIQEWITELGTLNKYNDYIPENYKKARVKARKKFTRYRDSERGNKIPELDEEWITNFDRAEYLEQNGFVDIIEKIKDE